MARNFGTGMSRRSIVWTMPLPSACHRHLLANENGHVKTSLTEKAPYKRLA